MKIDKLYAGLERMGNGDYLVPGDVISDDAIEIDLDDRLVVSGIIVSKKYIIANCGIKASRGVISGDGIMVSGGIEAGTFWM